MIPFIRGSQESKPPTQTTSLQLAGIPFAKKNMLEYIYLKKHPGIHLEYLQVFKFRIINYAFGDGRETLGCYVGF